VLIRTWHSARPCARSYNPRNNVRPGELFAGLGFAAVAFVAAWRSFDLRLAAVIGPAIFLLGAAAGHFYQMITAHNFAPGNAGVIFYMDIIIPLFGFALLWLDRHVANTIV